MPSHADGLWSISFGSLSPERSETARLHGWWTGATHNAWLTRSRVQSSFCIEDGNHIANNRPWRWRALSADWMAQQLGLPRQ
jgi:hypothetical protein